MTNSVRESIGTLRRRVSKQHIHLAAALALALGLTYAGNAYSVGPWWLWASDGCPAKDTVCGIIPMGPMLATLTSVIITGLIHR